MTGGKEFTLTLDGTAYKIVVDGNSVLVNGQPFVVGFEDAKVIVDGTPFDVEVENGKATIGGIVYELAVEGLEEAKAGPKASHTTAASEGAVTAIMPGKIIRLLVSTGDEVAEGDVVCILEAMKMENELKATRAGTVTALYVQPGQDVEMGAVLAEIE
jgi:acetyl-CoA/propionyl-CoA carboxylase, biotin carboxylase, biotin carboxyl carrier protein